MSKQSRPKLHVVDPLDYEGELVSRRKDLEKEKFLNLLLFPQQDVSVSSIMFPLLIQCMFLQ